MYTLFHPDSVSVNNVAMSYENGPEYFLQVSEKVGEREGGRERRDGRGREGGGEGQLFHGLLFPWLQNLRDMIEVNCQPMVQVGSPNNLIGLHGLK